MNEASEHEGRSVWEQWLLNDLFWRVPILEGMKGQFPTPGFPQILIFGGPAKAGTRDCPSYTQKPGQGSVGVSLLSLGASLACPACLAKEARQELSLEGTWSPFRPAVHSLRSSSRGCSCPGIGC